MSHTYLDIAGQRFGRLVAVSYISNGVWNCQCDCGKTHKAYGSHLRGNDIRSCGCARRERQLECKAVMGDIKRHPIAERIVRERIAQNLSRGALAKISGYSKVRIRAIEEATHALTIPEAEDILTSLGLTFSYTIGDGE